MLAHQARDIQHAMPVARLADRLQPAGPFGDFTQKNGPYFPCATYPIHVSRADQPPAYRNRPPARRAGSRKPKTKQPWSGRIVGPFKDELALRFHRRTTSSGKTGREASRSDREAEGGGAGAGWGR
jgi:hypothetical protein